MSLCSFHVCFCFYNFTEFTCSTLIYLSIDGSLPDVNVIKKKKILSNKALLRPNTFQIKLQVDFPADRIDLYLLYFWQKRKERTKGKKQTFFNLIKLTIDSTFNQKYDTNYAKSQLPKVLCNSQNYNFLHIMIKITKISEHSCNVHSVESSAQGAAADETLHSQGS